MDSAMDTCHPPPFKAALKKSTGLTCLIELIILIFPSEFAHFIIRANQSLFCTYLFMVAQIDL